MGRTVVIGLLGTNLDAGQGPDRWSRWRPSVSLCQHEDLIVDRLELLYPRNGTNLVGLLKEDIRHVSPETEFRTWEVEFDDPWDFQEVFGALHEFARGYDFDTETEEDRSEEHTSEL